MFPSFPLLIGKYFSFFQLQPFPLTWDFYSISSIVRHLFLALIHSIYLLILMVMMMTVMMVAESARVKSEPMSGSLMEGTQHKKLVVKVIKDMKNELG